MSKALKVRPTEVAARIEVPNLTPADVRKGIDVGLYADAIGDAQSAFLTATSRVVGDVMYSAALLSHAVEVGGAVGKDSKTGQPKDGALWATWGDYAAHVGYSPAMVSRLRLVGRAVVVHGIRKGSSDYTWLASHASKVSAAIKAEPGDGPSLADAIREAQNPTPEIEASTTQTPGEGDSGTAGRGARPNDGTAATGRDTFDTVGDVMATLRTLETWLRHASQGDAEKVHDRLVSLVADDRKRRAVLGDTVPGEVVESA